MSKNPRLVYGPIPSWRLGRSLGIDLLYPPKTCTFECIYCQLGKTELKVSSPEETPPLPGAEEVLQDLREVLKKLNPDSLDHITFSGSGEPTLNLKLGEIAARIREIAPEVPLAILTNSSLISREDVRRNLLNLDLVVAKLDAPTEELFQRINQPAEGITLQNVISGLKKLRAEMEGKLALQVMLLKSTDPSQHVGNFTDGLLKKLAELILEINPHIIYLNTPTRPPFKPYVSPLSEEELSHATKLLQKLLPNYTILPFEPPKRRNVRRKISKSELKLEVLEMARRRPCRFSDFLYAIPVGGEEVEQAIDELLRGNLLKVHRFRGQVFYLASQ
ncbi:MAG: radical SAM protein [Candidatus Verstraetearchaeota archaeon]|nr:radical SAM protein [Candidatus Verstraetearchaeota archaeon]